MPNQMRFTTLQTTGLRPLRAGKPAAEFGLSAHRAQEER